MRLPPSPTLLLLLPLTYATRSPPATYNPTTGLYTINANQSYTHHAHYTFTTATLPPGLQISTYTVADSAPAPYHHRFSPSGISLSNGYLTLTVPGGQTTTPLLGGEVVTTASNIRYASVRTTAILTDVAGVCNGFFFYQSDTEESDIEWLSSAASTSNPGNGSRVLFLTNQDADGDGEATRAMVAAPADAVSVEHEYRVDWREGWTGFFVDGVLVAEMSTDVPTVPGSWVWNNWANGDPGWTGDPPATDAVLRIKEIEMYYNTA